MNNQTTVNFTLQNGITVCEAKLYHQDKSITIEKMGVATFSPYVIITPDVASKLGINFSSAEKVVTVTATGTIALPKVIIQQIRVKDANAKDVEVVVGPLPEKVELDGLLGYSFLKHFKITIDYKKEELILIPN